jgi:hypothetical protein
VATDGFSPEPVKPEQRYAIPRKWLCKLSLAA